MKQYCYFFLLVFTLAGCAKTPSDNQHLSPLPASIAVKEVQRHLEQDFNHFQSLLEKNLAYREKTLAFYHQVQNKISQKIPLSGTDLDTINKGLADHLHLRQELYQAADKYKSWISDPPEELNSELQLQGVMFSLSSALSLYDNYLLAFSLYRKDKKLRRYLNAKHPGYDIGFSTLTEVTAQYNSLAKRQQVKKAITFYKSQISHQKNDFLEKNSYFTQFIGQSPSYNSTLKTSPLHALNRYGQFLSGITTDSLAKIRDEGVNLFSLIFGNSVGLVQTRKGHLHNNEFVHDLLASQLKAGDILLEKTPFRLTDKLIPGFWGHVAIWLGSEQELKDLGVWYHPAVTPHHQQIREGKHVVEALRGGVKVNSLGNFLNVDDLAILRPSELSRSRHSISDVLIRAFRQIGKPYDFNFDIETNDRIVCSELIYVAYANIQWPTQQTLGRFTISPTHIAEKVGPDHPFDIVTLYLKGKQVKDKKHQEFLKLL